MNCGDTVTEKHLDKMLIFIDDKMKFEVRYPIKTDIALNTIKRLMDNDLIPYCEIISKGNKNYFRKINFFGYVRTTSFVKGGFNWKKNNTNF